MPDSYVGPFRVLPENYERIYAVGDIHGNLKELKTLLDFVFTQDPLTENDLVVFLGDYIDRGPASCEVVNYVRDFRASNPNTLCLQGNHEEMLLSFLGVSGEHGDFYLANGGMQCFDSYGITVSNDRSKIRREFPDEHIEFFSSLEVGVIVGHFILVHAGIRPTVPLEEQDSHDLRWIRREFIHNQHRFGKTVVFGHTAFNGLFVDLPYKLGIDTGIAYGNALSIVELIHGDHYQIELGDDQPTKGKIPNFLPSGS